MLRKWWEEQVPSKDKRLLSYFLTRLWHIAAAWPCEVHVVGIPPSRPHVLPPGALALLLIRLPPRGVACPTGTTPEIALHEMK